MLENLLWIAGGLFVLLIIAASINMYFDSKKPARLYTLGLGQPERLSIDIEDLPAGYGGVSLERPCLDKHKPALLAHLEKTWGLDFSDKDLGRQRTLYCLKKIWNEGSVSLMLNAPEQTNSVNIDAMLAVDTASFVCLVQQAVQLDLLEHEEAWGVLFLNAQKAQSNFDSWQEYVSAYIKGREFLFKLSQEKETEAFIKFRSDIEEYGVKDHQKIPTKVEWLGQQVFSDFEVLELTKKTT